MLKNSSMQILEDSRILRFFAQRGPCEKLCVVKYYKQNTAKINKIQ